MKRCLAVCTIVVYLGMLFFGVASHAVSFKANSTPLKYFFVWDMFCGWSAYEERTNIIAEGESGRFYQLSPPPWGDFQPFGSLSRHHYDTFTNHAGAVAASTLRHTQHEPIARVFVIQEAWSKKFNLPDQLWNQRYTEPKDPYHYFHLRQIRDSDGNVLRSNATWFDYQNTLAIQDNPRLMRDTQKGKPMFQIDPRDRGFDQGVGGNNAVP